MNTTEWYLMDIQLYDESRILINFVKITLSYAKFAKTFKEFELAKELIETAQEAIHSLESVMLARWLHQNCINPTEVKQ